ncbi:MAG: hypothetical protein ACREVT_11920 [Burkholderiales bacterium]
MFPARARLIATLHLRHAYTQAAIVQATGLHYSTVSRIAVRQIHEKIT